MGCGAFGAGHPVDQQPLQDERCDKSPGQIHPVTVEEIAGDNLEVPIHRRGKVNGATAPSAPPLRGGIWMPGVALAAPAGGYERFASVHLGHVLSVSCLQRTPPTQPGRIAIQSVAPLVPTGRHTGWSRTPRSADGAGIDGA